MTLFQKIFIGLYLSALLIFIAHLFVTKTAIYGDGRFYYSYLPSYLINYSLDLSDSFFHLGISSFPSLLGPANIYPIGPAIIWAIPFILASLFLIPFQNASGYGIIYEIFIGISNISLVFVGIYLLRKTLLKFFDQSTSNLAAIAIFTTTNLLFYGAVDVINSHSASFFLSSVFLYLFTSKRNLINSVCLGITVGMLALVRSQDYIFLIFPLVEFLRKKNMLLSVITVIISLIVFLPQIFLWQVYFGGFIANPYLKVRSFDFLSPHFIGVFFNKNSGIIWTPIIFFCLYGLFKYLKRNFNIAFYSILIVAFEIYIIASWEVWWEGESYSARMLVSSLPFLGIGLASFLEMKNINKYKTKLVYFFSTLNILLILIFLITH